MGDDRRMKILVAPDSFKGSLAADEVAGAVRGGLRRVLGDVQVTCLPLADGGEGSLEVMLRNGGRAISMNVCGSNGKKMPARYGMFENGRAAFVEIAQACGLIHLRDEERNPLQTTSTGAGELLSAAIDEGAKRLIVGLGGSATNDGGAGMLQALGLRCRNAAGNVIMEPLNGRTIGDVCEVETSALDDRCSGLEIIIASDVDNPLLGPEGATQIFGPQKGASPAMVEELESNLASFYDVIEKAFNRGVRHLPGAGAAGGIGAALLIMPNASRRSGFELIAEHLDLENKIKDNDIVLTGEGRLDRQSLFGKVPIGVAEICRKHDTPVVAICGACEQGIESELAPHFDAIEIALSKPMTEKEAFVMAATNVSDAGVRVGQWLKLILR